MTQKTESTMRAAAIDRFGGIETVEQAAVMPLDAIMRPR